MECKLHIAWVCIFLPFLSLSGCGSGGSSTGIVASSPESHVNEQTLPENNVEGDHDSPIEGYRVGNDGGAGGGNGGANVLLQFNGGTSTRLNSVVLQQLGIENAYVPRFESSDLGEYYKNHHRDTLLQTISNTIRTRYQDLQINFALHPSNFAGEPYTTVFIGGSNFTGISQLLGVAPLDLDNFSLNDTVFVFPRELKTQTEAGALDMLINAITHELNHSFGARHIDVAQANLNPEIYTYTNIFDVEGPRVDNGDFMENTQEILLNNIGGRTEIEQEGTGLVDGLSIHKQDEIGQISPNFRERRINQRNLRFEWIDEDNGKVWQGRVLRLHFKEPGFKNIRLNVYKKYGEHPIERYLYRIGR